MEMEILINENSLQKDSLPAAQDGEKYFKEKVNELGLNLELTSENGYFNVLRKLDEMLLNGNLDENKKREILKLLFIERYVKAHAEDNNDEKPMNNALNNFISDNYDKGVHFFEEVLQNIDDAIGKAEKITDKKLNIKWTENNEIVFTYPDRGFSFYDTMAITSLGSSSKKGNLAEASIGEKGIGFKSIFCVADKVSIKSRFFSFDITYQRGKRNTSVLQPSCIYCDNTGEQITELTISFSDNFKDKINLESTDEKEKGFKQLLREWLFENTNGVFLHYSPFLFLKNIGKVEYSDRKSQSKNIAIRRETVDENTKIVYINEFKYLLFKKDLQFKKELINSRWENAANDKDDDFYIIRPIEIAFPVVEGDEENNKKGLFYSYLPTTMVIDFPVYINVDVHLKSSRGKISESDFGENSKWNEYVNSNLKEALLDAYQKVIDLYKNFKNSDEAAADCVKKVAEKLYIYICQQNTYHYFIDALKGFYYDITDYRNICPFYLNIEREFVTKDKILTPIIANDAEWETITEFCLNEPLPDSEKQFSFNYNWHIFTKNIAGCNCVDYKLKLLTKYNGVCNFYNQSTLDKDKKNKIVLEMLKDVGKSDDWQILFVESDNENGFDIISKNDAKKSGKAVFFHNDKDKTDDDDLSIYINKEVFSDEDYELYKQVLEGFVNVKDWTSFLSNMLKSLEDDSGDIYSIIDKTCAFLGQVNLKKLNISDKIEDKFKKFILPVSAFEKSTLGKNHLAYLKKIAESEPEKFGYEFFDISKCKNCNGYSDTLIDYLFELGVKHKPDVIDKKFDALTLAIMPNYSQLTSDADTLDFVYSGNEPELQKYLVDFANTNKVNVDLSCFTEHGLNFNLFIFIADYVATSFKLCAQKDYQYFFDTQKQLSINEGRYKYVKSGVYNAFENNCIKCKSRNPDAQTMDSIVKSIQSISQDFLTEIRWIQIWNKVFGEEYMYIGQLKLTLSGFLSCYKYLERADVDKMFKQVYSIIWEAPSVSVNFSDELVDYIHEEFGEKYGSEIKDNGQKYYLYSKADKEEKVQIEGKYKKLSNKVYKYIICIKPDSKTPKTDFVCLILEALGIKKVYDHQRLEISDILGEMKENKQRQVIGLYSSNPVFREAIFNFPDTAAYSNLLTKAKQLPSIYKKTSSTERTGWDMKRTLCEPFEDFEGYGYQCPICGHFANHKSLSEIKFIRRIPNADSECNTELPYLHLISCLNCADMLECADKVALKDIGGEPLSVALEHFQNVCYCADNLHLLNNSKMKTMKLHLKFGETEIVRNIKVSYLHLALFLKLYQKNDTTP